MHNIYFNKAINEALAEEMALNENVILLGEDIGIYGGAFGVTEGLLAKFGDKRVIQTPISENSFVGLGIGMSLLGLRPVIEIMFMDFITLAMDQIVNHAAKLHYMYDGQLNVPIVIRTPAGAKGGYGASHSQNFEQWFLSTPGIKVVSPSDAYTAKGLLKSAIRDPNPVLFVENKLLYSRKGSVPEDDYSIPLNKAIIRKEGKDVTVITYSRMVEASMKVAEILAGNGVDVEVLDLLTLKPLDYDTIIASIKKTQHVVIVEEGNKIGGVGSEVAAYIAENALEYMDGRIIRVGKIDTPIPAAISLEKLIIPDEEKIIEGIKKSLKW